MAAGLRVILQRQYMQKRLLALYLPWLLTAIAQGLILPVLPLYAKSFEASFALVGLVVAGKESARCWPICRPASCCIASHTRPWR